MNLLKRSSSYYFRITIPTALQNYTQRKELWLSLKTTDRAKAQYKASTISMAFRKKFTNLNYYIADISSMKQISYIEIKNLVEEDLNKSLLDIKRSLENLGPLTNGQLRQHEEYMELLRNQYSNDNLPEEEYSELVESFCASKNLSPTSRERRLIQHELIKALVAQEKAKILISWKLPKIK